MPNATRLDSFVAVENGGNYTIPAGINRLVVICSMAEHGSSGNHTVCNTLTLGGQNLAKLGGPTGQVGATAVYLSAEAWVLKETQIGAMTGTPQPVAGTFATAGATNTGFLCCTLNDAEQNDPVYDDLNALEHANTSANQTLGPDVTQAGGYGIVFGICSTQATTFSFNTQNGWAKPYDAAESALSKVLAFSKALTGASPDQCIVTPSGTISWDTCAIAFKPFTAPTVPPSISDVDTDENVSHGEALTVGGTDFGASQGATTVVIKNGTAEIAQSCSGWSATGTGFTINSAVCSSLPYGPITGLKVANVAGSSTMALTHSPPAGLNYVTVDVPWPGGSRSVLEVCSPPAEDGDLLEYETTTDLGAAVTMNADGTFIIASATGTHVFDCRVFDQTDQTWSAAFPVTVLATNPGDAPPNILTVSLDPMLVGIPFEQGISFTGTPAPVFSLTAGTPPAGLAMNSSGFINGTPLAAGPYSFTVAATNAIAADTQAYSGTVTEPPPAPVLPDDAALGDAIILVTGGPTVNDGLCNYFKAGGATGETLSDLERNWLKIVFPAGNANASTRDLWTGYLLGQGYAGASLDDMMRQFWIAGGA